MTTPNRNTTNAPQLTLHKVTVYDSGSGGSYVQPQLRDDRDNSIKKGGYDVVEDQVTDGGTYQATLTAYDGIEIVSVYSASVKWDLSNGNTTATSPLIDFEEFCKQQDVQFIVQAKLDGSSNAISNPDGWSLDDGVWTLDPYIRLKRKTLASSPPRPSL
ncbi:MAG: hypothetical protein ACRBN8_22125 [Nannocystales bacterium]